MSLYRDSYGVNLSAHAKISDAINGHGGALRLATAALLLASCIIDNDPTRPPDDAPSADRLTDGADDE